MVDERVITILMILSCSINVALLIAIILQTHCQLSQIRPKVRVMGGRKVAMAKYRYVTALVIVKHLWVEEDVLRCSACIISRYWLVTAAHCLVIVEKYKPDNVRIRATSRSWQHGVGFRVERYIKHRNYKTYEHDYDIGLIKTTECLLGPETMAEKVVFAPSDYAYITHSTAVVAGWGYFNDSEIITPYLRAAEVMLFSQRYCKSKYEMPNNDGRTDASTQNEVNIGVVYDGDDSDSDSDEDDYFGSSEMATIREPDLSITARMVCAGSYDGTADSCTYDSGGPLVQNGILIGIVSWGRGCASKVWPGVYIRLSYFHDWIENIIYDEK